MGESVTGCLRREIEEETGLEPSVHQPVHTVTWRNDRDAGRFAVYYYCSNTRETVSVSDEHVDHAWAAPSEATARLSTPQETAVARATGEHLDDSG